MAVFGHADDQGKPRPFHLYAMRQAIEEGFILNVLQNYTTYQLFFKLSKAIEEDPEINKKKGYQAEIKILVAFSGRVVDDNFPDGVYERSQAK
jgi:hypothetical protein